MHVFTYLLNFNTESADKTVFEYWHTSPLSAFHLDFQKLIDLNTLVPILCKNRVLCCSDLSMLHKLYQESRTIQVGKLVAILETKGKEGIYKLIESLKEDEEHIGHWELAKILEDKYGNNKNVVKKLVPYVQAFKQRQWFNIPYKMYSGLFSRDKFSQIVRKFYFRG